MSESAKAPGTLTPEQADKCRKWAEESNKQGLSNEWVVAARLGVEAYSEEQVKMISELFGR